MAAFPPSHTFVAYWSLSPRGGSLSAPNMLALSWGLAAAAPTDVVGCVLSVGGCLLSADSHALAAEKPKETKETKEKAGGPVKVRLFQQENMPLINPIHQY